MITQKLFFREGRGYFPIIVILIIFCLFQSCEKGDDVEQIDDTEAPVINILTPTPEGVFVTTDKVITITGIARDNTKLTSVEYSINSSAVVKAAGLEDWSINDLVLTEGDNLVKVTATDINNNQSSAFITITKNEYITFLEVPFVSKNVFFTNEETETWITVNIAPNDKLITSSVKLVEVDSNNTYLADVCYLNDDGNLENGDEIKGDNVFSVKHIFNFSNEGEKRYRIVAKTKEEIGEVEGQSAILVLTVIGLQKAELQVKEMLDTHLKIESKISSFFAMKTTQKDVENKIKEWLLTLPGVKNVLNDEGFLTIIHDSELKSYLSLRQFSEGEYETKGRMLLTSDNKKRSHTNLVPLDHQTRGEFKPNFNQTLDTRATAKKDDNIIQNKNILIWAAYEDDFELDMEPSLRKIFNNSPVDFEVTYLTNSACSAKSLENMANYGIVVLDTHGSNGDLIFTRDVPTFMQEHLSDDIYNYFSSNYSIVTTVVDKLGNTKTYCAVTSKFIKNNVRGKFPNSIIFNGSCQSLKTNLLSNSFIYKGAKTYLGFDNDVLTHTCILKANEFFSALTGSELKKTGESYISELNILQEIESSTWYCSYLMNGNNEMRFYLGLINGDFEYGNLNGWNVSGDGRIITQLAAQKPTQPYYMGIVSTGLGFTENYGKIYQSFNVTNETTLSLKWNFLSEEFMEFVGSRYQDYLKISISDGIYNEVLFYETIDSFAKHYSLIPVSPSIVFDQGGVYMTGWQNSSFDISKFKGKTVTLTIETGDIGDSVYDSATLLDEIKIY